MKPMTFRCLEEVTCDRCGAICTFEKFRSSDAERMYRIETMETWLAGFGWSCSDGLRRGQFCPTCTLLRKESHGTQKIPRDP